MYHNFSQLRKPDSWKRKPRGTHKINDPCEMARSTLSGSSISLSWEFVPAYALPHITWMHSAFKISSFTLNLIINAICNLHGYICNINVWHVARVLTSSFPFLFGSAVPIWSSSPYTKTHPHNYNIHNIVCTQNTNKIHREHFIHTIRKCT